MHPKRLPEELTCAGEPSALEARSPGEWIFEDTARGRALHVYRLAGSDWLVSEVGRGSEGRGASLAAALAMLRGDATLPGSWLELVGALEGRP